jgi:FkbM family methyltransferase
LKGFRVIAIEALGELCDDIRARLHPYLRSGQLTLINAAIADRAGPVTFFINQSISVWGTTRENWAKRNERLGAPSRKITVDGIPFGEVLLKHGIPYYLKVDIEGVDRLVLDGLKQFEARPRYVSIESEEVDFAELQAEMALLRYLGYTKFKPVQQQAVPGTKIRTKTLDGSEIEHVFEREASGPFGEDIPQPWLSFDDTLREYESIFRRYRRFGDHSLFIKMPIPIQKVIGRFYKIWTGYRGPLPGWYDTHASL